jgi:hypothetical protein
MLTLACLGARGAEELPSPAEETLHPLLLITGTYVGYRLQYFDYHEPSPDIREHGFLNGAVVGYDGVTSENRFFFKIELEYLTGLLTYDGSYQNNGGDLTASTHDHTSLLRLQFGKNYFLDTHQVLQVYSGFTARYLYDYVQAPGGYRREISQLTVPLGLTYRQALQTWSYGLTAEADILLSGKVKSHLSDVGPTYVDIENKQSQGYGFKLGADFNFPWNKRTIVIQPTWQYWARSDSDIDRDLLEPYNTSSIFNLALLLKF